MLKKRAVVLLSGGLDSATVLAMAREQGYESYALSVSYGQRHVAELRAAGRVVSALGAAFRRLSFPVAALMFFAYAALNGFTLSLIFIVYDLGAISKAFLSATAAFGVMTVVGYTTQVDLQKYRSYFMMGLIGLLVAMVINIFLRSNGFDILISMVGVVLFTALTAYDTQKIKLMASDPEINADGSLVMKLSIMGALALYLDFINLFLFLLRLFGRRR